MGRESERLFRQIAMLPTIFGLERDRVAEKKTLNLEIDVGFLPQFHAHKTLEASSFHSSIFAKICKLRCCRFPLKC